MRTCFRSTDRLCNDTALLWKSLIFSFRKDDLTSYKTSEWDIVTIVSFCWLALSRIHTLGRRVWGHLTPPPRSIDVPAQCCVFVSFTSPQDWKSSVRAGTCFTLVTAVFPAGTQSGPPSSEEPRTWGRKRAILSAFCTVWCPAPHRAISTCLWMGGERPVNLTVDMGCFFLFLLGTESGFVKHQNAGLDMNYGSLTSMHAQGLCVSSKQWQRSKLDAFLVVLWCVVFMLENTCPLRAWERGALTDEAYGRLVLTPPQNVRP